MHMNGPRASSIDARPSNQKGKIERSAKTGLEFARKRSKIKPRHMKDSRSIPIRFPFSRIFGMGNVCKIPGRAVAEKLNSQRKFR